MKHKRLNRDGWGFQYYPYYQMRVDTGFFHGLACLIRLTDGEANYWETPKAGKIQVTGEGMTWLELIPDGHKRVITIKYFPDNTHDSQRLNYPEDYDPQYQPSIWYVDITDGYEYDEDGIAVYIDKYLDVIFTPEGDMKIDDRDELDEAYRSGDISKEQYEDALSECDRVIDDLCKDLKKTNEWCTKIRKHVEDRISAGEPIKKGKEAIKEYYLDEHIRIRSMVLKDAEVLYNEYSSYGWHPSIETYENYYKDQEEGKRLVFIAEYDGRVSGQCTLVLNPEEGPWAGQKYPEIVDLTVFFDVHNKGIASKMLDAVEKQAAKISKMVYLAVGVHSGYGPAQRMYVKRGYNFDGSGVWYKGKQLEQYAPCVNDDDLLLFMSKELVG